MADICEMYLAKEREILSPYAFLTENTRGREKPCTPCTMRTEFQRDRDRIIHSQSFRRLMYKTQVFLAPAGDHYRTRLTHTLEVTQIARTIARGLFLNEDLTEAIALAHDLGHTPFGHAGEAVMRDLFSPDFSPNMQGVRVVEKLENDGEGLNLTYEVRDGIAHHSGSKMPCTLEGSVVRLSDIISYLGKDRQDAARIKTADESLFMDDDIGSINAEIINNLCVNVIENSYGKPYIKLDDKHFKALQKARRENYRLIYNNAASLANLDTSVKPMMAEIYGQLLDDLKTGNTLSPVYTHHINYVNNAPYKREKPYEQTDPNQIVIDYIASMTDDYLIELHSYLFPESDLRVEYQGYFNK